MLLQLDMIMKLTFAQWNLNTSKNKTWNVSWVCCAGFLKMFPKIETDILETFSVVLPSTSYLADICAMHMKQI